MCITLTGSHDFPLMKGIGTGYKVFTQLADGLHSVIYKTEFPRKRGEWLQGENALKYSTQCHNHGFHILLKEEDAYKYRLKNQPEVIVKVFFRNIIAHGTTEMYDNIRGDTIVAKEMFIPNDERITLEEFASTQN